MPSPVSRPASSRIPLALVGALTLIGIALRLYVAHQTLFADELSTYWIVTGRSLGGVWSIVGHRYQWGATPEISPPLYFMAAWLTAQLGHTAELVRGPSLVAGAVSIPVIYLLGLRTVGRRAALVAAAITALSPFMVYYSAEARPYALMMLLVMLSTLAMLAAVDEGRTRWWVLYAVASCAAIYTHYTCAFVLGAQLVWLLGTRSEARRPALLANACAVAGFLPWSTGAISELNSTTTAIFSALSPFTASYVRTSVEHWALGYPYADAGGLGVLPGRAALVLLGLAVIVVAVGFGIGVHRQGLKLWLARFDSRILLVLALLLATPIGEAAVSVFSTHLFGVRNLAASWPALALFSAAMLVASGPRLGIAAAGLAIVAFAIGVAKVLDQHFQRPNVQALAGYIDRHAAPGDAVVDTTIFSSPGPLGPLDATLERHLRLFRAYAPAERDHPFGPLDRIVPFAEAVSNARAGHPSRIFITELIYRPGAGVFQRSPIPGYRLVATRAYPGFVGSAVQVFARGG